MPESAQPKIKIQVRVSPDEYQMVATEAQRQGLSLSNLVRKGLKLPAEKHGARKDLLQS